MASLAALTFAVCCLRLFVLPHTALQLWGDAPGYATKGMRLLGGELPYRDFLEFMTPGTDIVYAILFRWLGVSLWVLHLVMTTLAALVAAMTWCAGRLVRGWFVFLPAVLLIRFCFGLQLDGNDGAVYEVFSATDRLLRTHSVPPASTMTVSSDPSQ